MQAKKEYLTTERLKKRYKNNFELANHAIKIARENYHEEKSMTLKEVIRYLELE